MQRTLKSAISSLLAGNGWEKLSSPSAARGKTAIPKNPAEVQRIGLRLDFDDSYTAVDGTLWHKFVLQVNDGDIPSTLKAWRDKNKRGTHAVMAKVEIRDGADKAEVEKALKEATEDVEGV